MPSRDSLVLCKNHRMALELELKHGSHLSDMRTSTFGSVETLRGQRRLIR